MGRDSKMVPRKRLGAVLQAITAQEWNGYRTATSVTPTGGDVLKLSQTANNDATVARSTLTITTSGTSNGFDYLLRGIDHSLGDVFTISRQGHTTTTGNLMVQGHTYIGSDTSDFLTVNALIQSGLTPRTDIN